MPVGRDRLAKAISSIAVMTVLPQVIWSFGSGRITMLVLESLGAIVDAITGLGRMPSQIRIGRRPWSGVKVGHGTEGFSSACAAKLGAATREVSNKLSTIEINADVCFTIWDSAETCSLSAVLERRDSINIAVDAKPDIRSKAVGDR